VSDATPADVRCGGCHAAVFRVTALILLCLLSGAAAAAPRVLGQPYFEFVAGSEKVGNGIITAITQDQRGLIWFGTPEGLYSFDGHRLRAYRQRADDPHSIGDDYVRALLPHSDGRLWVATQSAGLSIYDPRTDQFEHKLPRAGDPGALPGLAALALTEAPNGDVWIGFGNVGLAHWTIADDRFESFPPAPGQAGALQHDTARCLLLDRAGDLWIGTGNGLHRRRLGQQAIERVASEPGQPDSLDRQYVYALFEASDGRIWIGTQSNGAAVLDPASGRLVRFQTEDDQIGHPWVSGFVEPTPGEIWVHTYGGGIDVIDARTDQPIDRIRSDLSVPGGLTLDRLTAPFRDRSGLVWVGTWGAGVQHYNPHNAETFRTLRHSATRPSGLSSPSVMSTLPLSAGRVWVGTGGNGIDILDLELGVIGGHRPDAHRSGFLRDGTIRAMALDGEGAIWVGTQQAGLQRFDPTTQRFSEPIEGIPKRPIRQLRALRRGVLAIGMQAALLLLDPPSGKVRSMRLAAGRAFTDAVWALVEDPDDRLWISTPNALLYWNADADYPVAADSPEMFLGAMTDLRVDAGGVLWATGPRGIARLSGWSGDRPVFENFSRSSAALSSNLGQQVLPDRAGRLWSTQALIDPVSAQSQQIGVADGVDIGSVEIGSGSVSPEGLLFFGGTRGLLIVDPQHYTPWRFEAPLLLTSVDVDGHPQPPGGAGSTMHLSPDQRRLTVEFAALDYSAPDSIGYAYRLVGLDDDWIDVESSQRVASYHNLWPGQYLLELRARLGNGPWSTGHLSVPLSVEPRWWQTRVAALVAILLLLSTVHLGVRWRTRQMQRRAGELETLVARRTRELSQAKSGAESALAELKGAQRQLVAAEKMASLGQLVAGVAHEINTPVGIAITAASHLEELARDGNAKLASNSLSRNDLVRWKQDVESATRLILSSLRRAGALVSSFKQVSVDQSSGQRRCFKLDEFLDEVQTALNPTIRRTPHRLSIDCPPQIDLDSYPGALFQILTNLINNALMHAFTEDRSGQMRISARAEGEQLELRFSDDGCGMPEAVAARAFDPFFTTRRGSGGSGLGLHVAHNLLTQLLAGQIELRTAPGHGTEVLMRFARHTPESTRAAYEF
jgi:signal transduction histidine kinase/ligand-binding sensor domain-containing protein